MPCMLGTEKTLESPLDCKEIEPAHPKGDQSWIFTGRTDAEAETPLLWHLMWRTDSLEKTLMLGKIEGRGSGYNRGWDGWMTSSTQWLWAGKLRELVMVREALPAAVHGVTKSRTWLSHWTDLNWSQLDWEVDLWTSFPIIHGLANWIKFVPFQS